MKTTEGKAIQRAKKMDKGEDMASTIMLHKVTTGSPQQVKIINCCSVKNRFTQQTAPNRTSIRLKIETLHSVHLDWAGNSVVIAKDPIHPHHVSYDHSDREACDEEDRDQDQAGC